MTTVSTVLLQLMALALHVGVIVTLLAAAGLFVSYLARNASAPFRHTLMLGVLAAIVIAPAIGAIYQWRLISFRGAPIQRIGTAKPPAAVAPTGDGFIVEEELSGTGPSVMGLPWKAIMQVCLLAIWLTGILVCVVMTWLSLLGNRPIWRSLRSLRDDPIQQTVDNLRRQLGVRRRVRVAASRFAPCPFTVGLIWPMIVIPERAIKETSDEQLEAALIHELAHVARYDYGMGILSLLTQITYWWCPFVARIVAHLTRASEEICDAHAQHIQQSGSGLAKFLVSCAEHLTHNPPPLAIGLTADHHALEARVSTLLNGDQMTVTRPTLAAKCLVAFVSLVFCLVCVHANYVQAQFVIGTPVNFGPILNTEYNEVGVLSNDGLTFYLASNRPGTTGGADILTSSRISLESEWSAPEIFAPATTSTQDFHPFISDDGLTFLYTSGFDGGDGLATIYRLSRDTIEDPWGPRFALPAPINDGVSHSRAASMSPDGLTMIFSSQRAGGEGAGDIWEAVRPSLNDSWTARVLGPNVNTSANELDPLMSSDGLTLLFGSLRDGGEGNFDIWLSTRDAIRDEWEPASNLGPTVNTGGGERPAQLWEPGNLLLFASNSLPGEGGGDIFYVSVIPEPSTAAMSISGALLLMGFVRRRRGRPYPNLVDRKREMTNDEYSKLLTT